MDGALAAAGLSLRDLARAWGIVDEYYDAFGVRRQASTETCYAFLQAMGCSDSHPRPRPSPVIIAGPGRNRHVVCGELHLEDGAVLAIDGPFPPDLPIGYHTLRSREDDTLRLIISRPAKCFLPPELKAGGWAVQLYATRSEQSWGFGDLADLRHLAHWSAQRGASMMLLNPLCAVAPTKPQQQSPYYPTSRCFHNPLYINVAEVPGAAALGADLERLAAAGRGLNQARKIDRDAVFELKMAALEKIWSRGINRATLDAYCRTRGAHLETFAVFCALCEHLNADWRQWPAEYSSPDSSAVRRFAQERVDRVRFHQWLQAVLDEQLAQAAQELPLVYDLPIGFDPGGADAWAWQDVMVLNAHIGAPPDPFNTLGQDWALPPFAPQRLQAAHYRPLIETVRATLRHAGGIRVDHVMGLFRQYWIREGDSADSGCYVRFPAEELLAILAVESHRARAWVAGEDLGTVEPGVREQLASEDILSHRLLWFDDNPASYPWRSIAAVTTHDLPTIGGLCSGADVAAQRSLGFSPDDAAHEAMRRRLYASAQIPPDAPLAQLIVETHRGLARSPSAVVTATLTDALGVEERPNMPGTIDAWPNWSLALPATLEQIVTDPAVRQVADAMARR